MSDDLEAWLLDSDPALVWQVQRDVLGEPEDVWRATKARTATEGFGARLLSHQDPDGQWAGGAYFPGDFGRHEFETEPQPWTATTWSLNMLREWGVDASALGDTAEKLAANSRWEYDDLPYWGGEVDCCINGFTLANGAWLGVDVSALVGWFAEHRMADGGWNCEWVSGDTRSSFHSTLNSLKGLVQYEALTGESTRQVRRPGEEYLLDRGLFRRLSTGETVADWAFRFAYPFRWRYSVLNAADYFRSASALDGGAPDPRMAEAIDRVREQRRPDGSWLQAYDDQGRVWFRIDVPEGEPSKWLTLSGHRVLDWWDDQK